MNLWKKIAQVTLVAGAALWMYNDASSLPAFRVQTEMDLEQAPAVAETEIKSETEAVTETESESESETVAVTETETESETEAITETESETETSTEALTETETESETETSTEAVTEVMSETESSQVLISEGCSPSFASLRTELKAMISEYEGSWSIYVRDLQNSNRLTINSQSQSSASLIKLYIAGAVLEEIQSQNLERTETIDQLLTEMITVSDNEAANELVRYLSDTHDHQDGLQKVNAFIENHDFVDTHQYNGLEDSALWYYPESVNVTSVADCGRLLEEIYEGDFISHLISRELEGYLLNQEITWKIPTGIPSEIKTANKTGETDNTQNDISLVFTPYGDYIICVMATDLTDTNTAIEHIRTVSGTVYEYFTKISSLHIRQVSETKVVEYVTDAGMETAEYITETETEAAE